MTSRPGRDGAATAEAPSAAPPGNPEESALYGILALLAGRRGIDFHDYRRAIIRHRLELRLRATGCADLAAYRARLPGDSRELDRLVEALVIPVTAFFRDPHVFRGLAERVLPSLGRRSGFVRAWVAGCATGEEAYSVAILLGEAGARQRGAGFEVIASDLDQRSLEVARAGLYPESALEAAPRELRERYFRREPGGLRVIDSIRGRVRFVQHDLVGSQLAPSEAIVAAFDAVFCRNVLLYFDTDLRVKAARRLAAVLEPGAALVLGLVESLPAGLDSQLEDHPELEAGCGVFRKRDR